MLTAMSKAGRWVATGLAGSLVFALAGIAAAQSGPGSEAGSTANVEVRVWQSVSDAGNLYVSARAVGGSWRDFGTRALDMRGLSASGRYRYGDIPLDVHRSGSGETATVQVRVWQSVSDPGSLYVSARWDGGSWYDLGTRALDLNDVSSSRRHRYGDIVLISPAYLPTILFHGVISERRQGEIREKILNTITFYLNVYGVVAPDVTFHIGENASVLRRLIDETVGEPSNISCGLYISGGVIFSLLSCDRAIEHEYFHAIQDHSIDHDDWGPLWLTEGFAEYASRIYRDNTGQEKYEEAIALDLETLGRVGLVSLQRLNNAPLWFGDAWAMVTLAADWLAGQASGDPFAYYRTMSQGIPWEEAFRRVFGMDVGDMYQDFENYLNEVAPIFRHIRGVVLGYDENPIRDYRLDVIAYPFDNGSDLSQSATVDDDGAFSIHAPDGTYVLVVGAQCQENWTHIGWYSEKTGITPEYYLASVLVVDADVDAISIKIPRRLSAFSNHCSLGEYRSLSGVVYHSDGSPFPDIRITAVDAGFFVRDVSITDENGTFSIQIPDSSYSLEIRSECENNDSAFLGVYHPNGGFTPVHIVGEEPRILVDGRDVPGVTIRIPDEYANECQRYRQ